MRGSSTHPLSSLASHSADSMWYLVEPLNSFYAMSYQLDEDEPGSSFQEGFSAEHFVAVVEPDQLWGGI